ncbi:MAG: hypothetical protein R2751_18905 [Bacteroidales bacterium]
MSNWPKSALDTDFWDEEKQALVFNRRGQENSAVVASTPTCSPSFTTT